MRAPTWTLQTAMTILLLSGAGCVVVQQSSQTPQPLVTPTASLEVATSTLPSETSLDILATSTPYGCPGGTILFESYADDTNTEPRYYDVCADGSQLEEVTVDSMTFLDNLSPDRKMRVWVADEENAIKITDVTGQKTITILADNLEKGEVHQPSWSTDGAYVSYLKETISANGIIYDRVDMVHLVTGTITRGVIPNDKDPGWDWVSWSPTNNQLLLFSRQRSFSTIYVGDVSCDKITHLCTTQLRPMNANKGASKFPWRPWSQDGLSLAYSCYKLDTSGIRTNEGLCVQDVKGNLLKVYTEAKLGVEDIDYLNWSPDATYIVFTAYPTGKDERNVFVLSLLDGAVRNLSSMLTGHQESPVWVP